MKLKLALFLFALGFGTTAAFASGPSYAQCKAMCTAQYNACLSSGTPVSECKSDRASCIPDCMLW